jgi:hypothetical protein
VTLRSGRAALLAAVLVASVGLATVSARAATARSWTGTFPGFPGAVWATAWGRSPELAWGLGRDLAAVSDVTSPGGAVLGRSPPTADGTASSNS